MSVLSHKCNIRRETPMSSPQETLNNEKYTEASELWYEAEIKLKSCIQSGNEKESIKALETLEEAVRQRFVPILDESRVVAIFLSIVGGIIHFACRDSGLPPAYLTMEILGQNEVIAPCVSGSAASFSSVELNRALRTCIRQACSLVKSLAAEEYSTLVKRCIGLIQAHLTDDLSIAFLADSLGVTRQYLSSRFKAETGLAMTDYINQQRIALSKYYLRQDKLTITQIAVMCGYSDSNYYGRMFRKLEHITPADGQWP